LHAESYPLKTRIFAVAWPLFLCLVANVLYQVMSYFPGKRYLEWMEKQPTCWANNARLPDFLLDAAFSGISENDIWTPISDTFPTILLVTTFLYLIVRRHYVLLNRTLMTQGFLIFVNGFIENATTLPSSYGHDRCLDYLQIQNSTQVQFGLNLTGSCAAMIWSGHTLHTLLACYMLGKAFEVDYKNLRFRFLGVVHVKSVLCVFIGLLEAFFLVMAHAHYTVDMLLAILIGMLTLTNHSLKMVFLKMNPFLWQMIADHEKVLLTRNPKELRYLARK